MERSDRLTIAAIAIMAMCIVTFDHEALGHGSACLLLAGKIKLLTSVYFDCSVKAGAVAAGGPLGNLLGGAIAWALLLTVPKQRIRPALFFILIGAFAVFWEAGYLLKAMITSDGDSYFAARGLFGAPELPWRVAGLVLGVLLYMIGIRVTQWFLRRFSLPPQTLPLTWQVAASSAVAAAALYEPDRMGAMTQAALEIGAASAPLLWPASRDAKGLSEPIQRSFGWIAAGAIVYVAFVASLGHGLPYGRS